MSRRAFAPLACLVLAACGARTGMRDVPEPAWCEAEGETRACRTACGEGEETCVRNVFVGCTAPAPKPPTATVTLQGTLRDLHDTHPDVESVIGDDHGMVEKQLGLDGKPVYAGHPTTPTTHGAEAYLAWWHDVPGVNTSLPHALVLTRGAGLTYAFDDPEFFPLDGLAFGNEGRPHNYHFTYEVHGTFEYRGGEVFTFRGDDDLFLFVNGGLAIDLGGVHGPETATVSLDARAKDLGLSPGNLYAFDLFFAERHASMSSFHIETTIAGFDPCE